MLVVSRLALLTWGLSPLLGCSSYAIDCFYPPEGSNWCALKLPVSISAPAQIDRNALPATLTLQLSDPSTLSDNEHHLKVEVVQDAEVLASLLLDRPGTETAWPVMVSPSRTSAVKSLHCGAASLRLHASLKVDGSYYQQGDAAFAVTNSRIGAFSRLAGANFLQYSPAAPITKVGLGPGDQATASVVLANQPATDSQVFNLESASLTIKPPLSMLAQTSDLLPITYQFAGVTDQGVLILKVDTANKVSILACPNLSDVTKLSSCFPTDLMKLGQLGKGYQPLSVAADVKGTFIATVNNENMLQIYTLANPDLQVNEIKNIKDFNPSGFRQVTIGRMGDKGTTAILALRKNLEPVVLTVGSDLSFAVDSTMAQKLAVAPELKATDAVATIGTLPTDGMTPLLLVASQGVVYGVLPLPDGTLEKCPLVLADLPAQAPITAIALASSAKAGPTDRLLIALNNPQGQNVFVYQVQ